MNYSTYKPEQKEDVIALFNHAFTDSEGKEEGAVIAKLTDNFLSFPVKEEDQYAFIATNNEGRIVGCIIFSRLYFPNGENIFLLSPVSVATDCHGQGIGQTLIRFGLESLKEKGVTVAITYGDINFYSKTGFSPISEEIIQAPLPLSYPEGWIAQSLLSEQIEPIKGKPTCVEALNNPAYW